MTTTTKNTQNTTSAQNVAKNSQQISQSQKDFDKEKTESILSDLYKNATMAQNAIKTLLPYVEEKEVTRSLHKQVEDYDAIIEGTGTHARQLHFDPTPAPKTAVFMSSCALRMKMITDKSTTHVAKIMMQGTLNGIIDLYRLQKRCTADVESKTVQMVQDTLDYEEKVFESLKRLL